VSVEHLVQRDYDRARRKAFWRQVASRLLRRNNALLRWDEVRERLRAQVQHAGGLREVPIDHIVGSVGRYHDFDRAFLPRRAHTRQRWMSVDRAHYHDVPLPPVELYCLGETYFVKDGNHRVSVARERGQEFIDANVIQVEAPAPISSLEDLEEWIRRQDALEFFERTQLLRHRPEARVELTLPGQHEKLLEHIDVHRWYMGIEQEREIPYPEAVADWYDLVYLPLARIIRTSGILREFPNRTEADLYLWIIEHQWFLRQSSDAGEERPLEEVARGYAAQFSERPVKRLVRAARRRAQRVVADLVDGAAADGDVPQSP